ncbi:MAG: ParA family protein, partial [Candidatus Binatus sp.]
MLNMKGGVGKTTIAAHVTRVLYRELSKKTLLIDLDPQFNLTQCVITRSNYDSLKKANSTIFAAMEPPSSVGLFDVATSTQPPPKPDDLAIRLRRLRNDKAYLDLVAGDFDLVKYSLISDQHKLHSVQQRFLHFVALARAEYDLIVIDCNPSSSFITLCALTACSRLLVPIRPDRYSILGLELLANFLERIPTIIPKPRITILLNGIPRQNYKPAIENELRAHKTFGSSVLAQKLHYSRLLLASSEYVGFATDKPVPHRTRLEKEISDIVTE